MEKQALLILLTSIAHFLFSSVSSLDLQSAREQPCFPIRNTVPLDINWVSSVETFFFPRMSRFDLYHTAVDLLDIPPGDVEEGAMYYDSCITFNFFPNGSFASRGYNGRAKVYNTRPIKPNAQEVQYSPADGQGLSATFYSTFTDNKTFAVILECSSDGVMGWSVLSSIPVLPNDSWQQVRNHVLSLGFRKEYFTELRYGSNCLSSLLPPSSLSPQHNGGRIRDSYGRVLP